LVGDGSVEQVKWRDGPVLSQASGTGWGLADANLNYSAVITDLQLCATALQNQGSQTNGLTNNKGFRWAEDMGGMSNFNTIVPPNSTTYPFAWCQMNTTNGNASDGLYQNATSNHPGGCNYLFADGSVHFLKSSLGMKTYWALGTKAGGEVISSDSY